MYELYVDNKKVGEISKTNEALELACFLARENNVVLASKLTGEIVFESEVGVIPTISEVIKFSI